MTQTQALEILKTGANVFLTGEPGAGKTHVINLYVSHMRRLGVEPAITASTGIAATHIGGMTIHSWSGIGIKKSLTDYDLDQLGTNEYLVKRVNGTAVLIIDEISMLSGQGLEMVDQVCRSLRRSEAPFGGLQVVLVGDFFQLPPVSRTGEGAKFAFHSLAWRSLEPITCYLHEQHRQDDKKFLAVLSAMRLGKLTTEHHTHLESRAVDYDELSEEMTKLFTHNADVDRLNNDQLDQLDGEPAEYQMLGQGKESLVEALKKSCLSPERLVVRPQAVVMFTKNNPSAGFANGTLGVVVDYDPDSHYPVVRTKSGKRIVATPMEWAVEEGGKVRARVTQIPLRLAWAITIHKSQGMSLDAAVIDLGSAFEYGQGYVALSRVRRLSGLHLLRINEQALLVHPEILKRDNIFRTESTAAEVAFKKIPKERLKKMHDNFVRAAGGVVGRRPTRSRKCG